MPKKSTKEVPVTAPRTLTIPLPDFSRYKNTLIILWMLVLTSAVAWLLVDKLLSANDGLQTSGLPSIVQKSAKANLSLTDRQAVKDAIAPVLSGTQETAAEVREDLRYQLQGKTLSPGFVQFNADWQAALNKAPPAETAEDVKKKLTLLRDNL
jgi:hypothetical protein